MDDNRTGMKRRLSVSHPSETREARLDWTHATSDDNDTTKRRGQAGREA